MPQSYSLRTDKTWQENVRELRAQFERWGITSWQIDAIPEADGTRARVDPAVARRVVLHFELRGTEITFIQERQNRRVDNLRVLCLIVESMRLNEVRGIGDAMRDAYLALPPPSGLPLTNQLDSDDPYVVLGVPKEWTLEQIDQWYKVKAKRLHPDSQNGDATEMTRLNVAMDAIREERKS